MATPKTGYRDFAGKRLPGTTTIIGRFKHADPLMYWAWKCGMDGIDYRASRDAAASAGTYAHAMVEHHIKQQDPALVSAQITDEDIKRKAIQAFQSYLTWQKNNRLRIVATEIQLVSLEYEYGGTPDAVGKLGRRFCLPDWKTSNAIYADYLIQLAAYRHLIEHGYIMENGKLTDKKLGIKINGGFHLCRFSKDHGDFAHHYFDQLDDAWRVFLNHRDSYDRLKTLEKRAA